MAATDEIDYEKLMEYFGEVQARKRQEKVAYEMSKRKIKPKTKKTLNDNDNDDLANDFYIV